MNNTAATVPTTAVEAGFVRIGETITDAEGATMRAASFEAGPEAGEVSLYGPTVGGLHGERYIFATDALVTVVGHRHPNWAARA